MNTETKLAAAIQAVEGTLPHLAAIYTNGQALTARAETARQVFMNRMMATSGDGSPLNIPRGWVEIETILHSDAVTSYVSAKAICEAVLTSPEYLEAVATLAPFIAEVRKLEGQLAAENEAAGKRAAEREAAIAKATAEALAAVDAQFAEPPPAVEPAKPFRGKVRLEADPV